MVKTKVFLIGCVKSTEVALKTFIINQNVEVCGILTCRQSTFNSDFSDITKIANIALVPIFYFEEISEKNIIEFIKKAKIQNVFVVGWSRLLSKNLIKMKNVNSFGYHPAALPQNRGRHPIIWALALGLNETASTFFRLQDTPDSGSVINQKKINITNNDYASDLYNKILNEIPKQINEIIQAILIHSIPEKVQDYKKSNYWRKRKHIDGIIDWRMPAEGIYNLIRALSHPYPGAEFQFCGLRYNVMKSIIIKSNINHNLEPGKVIDIDASGLLVKCGTNAILLNQLNKIPNVKIGDYL